MDDRNHGEGSVYVHALCDLDVVLPTVTSQRRDQFTVAHELGHYFLHSDQGRVPIVAYRLPARERGRTEWEANWFAAGLLMPAQAFREALLQHGKHIPAVADCLNVSVQAAQVRAQVLGLV
jgi:Zn-dependent peptidase ImmA (M78 family)